MQSGRTTLRALLTCRGGEGSIYTSDMQGGTQFACISQAKKAAAPTAAAPAARTSDGNHGLWCCKQEIYYAGRTAQAHLQENRQTVHKTHMALPTRNTPFSANPTLPLCYYVAVMNDTCMPVDVCCMTSNCYMTVTKPLNDSHTYPTLLARAAAAAHRIVEQNAHILTKGKHHSANCGLPCPECSMKHKQQAVETARCTTQCCTQQAATQPTATQHTAAHSSTQHACTKETTAHCSKPERTTMHPPSQPCCKVTCTAQNPPWRMQSKHPLGVL